MLLLHRGYGIFGSSPNFTHFHLHSPHVLLSRLICPHYGSPQCGHSASASVDSHPASDATFKVEDQHADDKLANEDQPLDKERPEDLRMHGGQVCIVCDLNGVVALIRWAEILSFVPCDIGGCSYLGSRMLLGGNFSRCSHLWLGHSKGESLHCARTSRALRATFRRNFPLKSHRRTPPQLGCRRPKAPLNKLWLFREAPSAECLESAFLAIGG